MSHMLNTHLAIGKPLCTFYVVKTCLEFWFYSSRVRKKIESDKNCIQNSKSQYPPANKDSRLRFTKQFAVDSLSFEAINAVIRGHLRSFAVIRGCLRLKILFHLLLIKIGENVILNFF